jgi:hypothetical protein
MEIPDQTKSNSLWFETRRIFTSHALLGCVALPFGSLLGRLALAQEKRTRKNIPGAPLPATVVNARKVFLLDGQTTAQGLTKNGNALAFDTLYTEMKSWGKYELVDSRNDADIVIELQYRPYSDGSRSFGLYNPSTHTVQTRSVTIPGADFALVLYEAKSKEQLWSVSDACGLARLVKNQQKEVIKSIGRLVEGFKAKATPSGLP